MYVHGKDALKPRRKEPIRQAAYERAFRLPRGTKVGSLRAVPGDEDFQTLLDMISTLDDTGFRKAECIETPEDVYLKCLTVADVSWCIGGTVTRNPTPEMLASMTHLDCVWLTPTNSKCDNTAEYWGTHPIPVPFEAKVHNAAYRLRERWHRRLSDLILR